MFRLHAKTADVSTSPIPHLGERSYLQVELQMTASQQYDAICVLLGALPDQRARELLLSEFPQLLEAA